MIFTKRALMQVLLAEALPPLQRVYPLTLARPEPRLTCIGPILPTLLCEQPLQLIDHLRHRVGELHSNLFPRKLDRHADLLTEYFYFYLLSNGRNGHEGQ